MDLMRVIAIGVDIGQRRDPTAIAVVEQRYRQYGQRTEEHFLTRYLERLPLDTPYPRIASRLEEIVHNAYQAASKEIFTEYGRSYPLRLSVSTYIDATGVGKPVVDILEESGLNITPVYFTHGDRRTKERGQITLGKAWLVSRLQALFQTRRLELPRNHPEAEAMRNELLDYEIKVSQDANDKYGAFKTGTHDDLVTAVGLATQDTEAIHHARFSRDLDEYSRAMGAR